ncbi:phage tail protein, partial [Yersinia kristensenii]|uniref:phage tail protein n=2 Tax=Yersinia kristensenii TaxID=28152 RepID=UPI0022FF101F
NATALGTRLEITQMAVGDGGGTLPTPNPAQTQLVNEQRRAALNMLTVDPVNTSQIIAEQVIPEAEGGWWIREIGLLDKDGDLIAIANCAETYKPQLQEGSGRTQTIRVILIVSSTAAVTLKIDPSVVLATRKYADDKDIEVKAYADDLFDKHAKATDPHKQYLKTTSNLVEIKNAGVAAVAMALSNIGALPVGGVAASAKKLETPRKIAGKAFDGSADITIAAGDVGALPSNGTAAAAIKLATARNIAGKAFDGSADITIAAGDVGALPSNGTAAAATKLATARKIAGKAFDGSADITIAAGDVGALPSNGTAAAATKLATARNIAGKSFDGTANISIGASDVGALPITGGELSGPLAVNGTHDAPLGPGGFRSCLATPPNGGITNPSGTGIGLHSNGTIYAWNDATGYAFSLSPTLMSFSRPVWSTGTITPGDYSNFDTRFSKFGVSQAWTDVLSGRVSGTWYTNSTSKPIMISVTTVYGPNAALNCQTGSAGTIAYPRGGGSEYIQHNATFIVVPGDTYRVTAAGTIGIWMELR